MSTNHYFSSFFQKPARDEWGSALEAMQEALKLEKEVNQSLLDIHKIAAARIDPQVISNYNYISNYN